VLHEGTSERARVVGVLDGVLGDLAARGLRVTAVSRLLRAAHEGS
jgi:hypothetical protein